MNHIPFSAISFFVLNMDDHCDRRESKYQQRINTIIHLSNRNDGFCILHTTAILSITNQTIPTVFTIVSSIVAKQDQLPHN